MTIETTAIKAVATGNSATTIWPYTFLIPADSDLVVTLVDVASGNPTVLSPTLYTATGIGEATGGTVTYPLSGSPLTSATSIVIERALPLTQETDLQNQGAVYPSAIEDALDYLTMITQQLQDQLNRAIVFSVADTVETTLPVASARADLFLGFDSAGDPIAVDGLTAGTTVSAAMIPVVTAPTTAAALVALGIPGSLADSLFPAGVMFEYTGTSAPAGWLLAFGSPCTGLYPVLRAQLVASGSPYGTNGVDPLLPDRRSRVSVGKSNMGGADNGLFTGGTVLGAVAGNQSKTLATAEIPAHLHAVFLNDPGHVHTYSVHTTTTLQGAGAGFTYIDTIPGALVTNSGTNTTGMTVRDTAGGLGTANQTANAGGGAAFSIVQPSLINNVIIKVH